jgi:FkbM family methyltransferase
MIKLIVRGIRKLYFQIVKRFSDTITVRTDYGTFKVFTHDRIIGYTLYKDKKWEIDFPREVFNFIKVSSLLPGKITLIDLGANIGITSIPFIQSGWVDNAIAVEADGDNYRLLSENVRANQLADRIFPIHAAVTEYATELTLEKSTNNFGDHRIKKTDASGAYSEHLRRITTVKGDTLPNLIRQAPFEPGKSMLIWIDIQGHEGYCFRGASEWLRAARAPAVSEIWPYAIERSGMSLEEFSTIVTGIWSAYYVWRNNGFVRFDMSEFPKLLASLTGDQQDNIILVP